jgi:hypothetical protein
MRQFGIRRELVAALGGILVAASGSEAAAAGIAPSVLARYALVPSEALLRTSAATNRIVSSCADDQSPGTLRAVAGVAQAGDTIDLSGLPDADSNCFDSTITLATGVTFTPSVTLKGPSGKTLTIAGGGTNTVLGAQGALTIENLTIRHGRGTAKGGCIVALGGLTLSHSVVTDCIATGSSKYAQGSARGGAIYGTTVSINAGSRVDGGSAIGVKATGSYKYLGLGGNVFAKTTFSCSDSTIRAGSANFAAGGVLTYGSPTLTRCTIEGNSGGGLFVPNTATSLTIEQSTISGNSSSGVFAQVPVTMRNSTIAFNTAPGAGPAGLYATTGAALYSSIIAANSAVESTHADMKVSGVLTGADNLVVSTDTPGGAGVITVTEDPQLLPLDDNGGPTRTHALAPTSPAIDVGSNAALFPTDQRGGLFVREVPAGSPDIGAFEFRGDGIFYDGFE